MWYMLKEIQKKQDTHERELKALAKAMAANEIARLKAEIAVLRGQPVIEEHPPQENQ